MSERRGQRTVLVVDDDEDFLFQMEVQLKNAGFSVVTAAGQKAAEALIGTCSPDLVILDLMMEQPDAGFVLAHRFKKEHPGVPVILVTAVTSETGLDFEDASPGERTWIDADAWLTKPVRFEQLSREIERLLPAEA